MRIFIEIAIAAILTAATAVLAITMGLMLPVWAVLIIGGGWFVPVWLVSRTGLRVLAELGWFW
jgi:hypothetical protein